MTLEHHTDRLGHAAAQNESLPDIDRHPLLVLANWRRQCFDCALITIVHIDGKSPRDAGAAMVVRQDGAAHGYVTGGCLERELALVGQQAIASREARTLRYGKGSPFIDIRLPCGAGLDVHVDPNITDETVFKAEELLLSRQPFLLSISKIGPAQIERESAENAGHLNWTDHARISVQQNPPVRLRIFGTGKSPLQLALMAKTAGLDVSLMTSDAETRAGALALGVDVRGLSEMDLTDRPGDAFTADVLMFHDHDRELPLLEILAGQGSFYLAAMGNASVAQQRRAALRARGLGEQQIARIRARPGLIANARSATELAIGILAEILDVAKNERNREIGPS